MVLQSKRGPPANNIPMSSMADVAFLLLVFFLVTTVFPRDKGLALVLPETETNVNEGNVLHFLIESSGSVEVRYGVSQQSQFIEYHEVEAVWRSAFASNPRIIAAVKTAPDASYKHMVRVLDELHSAGAPRISLQVLER